MKTAIIIKLQGDQARDKEDARILIKQLKDQRCLWLIAFPRKLKFIMAMVK